MTVQKSFKRLVRLRMEKTGESYTAARASLLAAAEPLATSDEEITRRTGRGWEEWFDRLDEWGGPERSHREKARWLAEQLEAEPLAWNVQAIVHSYELARGLREVGEKDDGTFSISASQDCRGAGGAALRRVRTRVAERAHSHEAPVGAVRLERRAVARECRVRGQGRGEEHRRGGARAAA